MFLINRICGKEIRNPFVDRTVCWNAKWSENAQKNDRELYELTQKIAKEMGCGNFIINMHRSDRLLEDCIVMQSRPLGPGTGLIEYNYLSLINPEDLPSELHLKGIDDPCLSSPDYMAQVVSWIKKFTGLERQITEPIEIEQIKGLLKLFLDRDKTLAARKFTIAHEISHLILEHHKAEERIMIQTQGKRQLHRVGFAAMGALGCKVAGFSLFPAGVVTAAVVYKVSHYIYDHLYRNSIGIEQELEADANAKKIVGPEGGYYLHAITRQHQLSVVSTRPFYQKMLFSIMDHRFVNMFVSANPTHQQVLDNLKKIR